MRSDMGEKRRESKDDDTKGILQDDSCVPGTEDNQPRSEKALGDNISGR